jgi:hypothetical protein
MPVRPILLAALCLSMWLSAAHAGGKYADAVQVTKDFLGVMGTYMEKMEAASDADAVAAAMNWFADAVEPIVPDMRAIAKKYPELRDPATIPPEFQKLQQDSEAMAQRFSGWITKISPYLQNPKVQAAQKRVAETMMRMNQ